MSGYSKMEIMSKTNEELRDIMAKEGDALPGYMVSMIVDELQSRKDAKDQEPRELSDGDLEDLASLDGAEPEEYSSDDGEDFEEDDDEDRDEEPSDDDDSSEYEHLSSEERAEREIAEVEIIKKERTKTLIIASVAAGVTALAITVLMLVLYFTGNLS